ncbi:Ig-like domain-containing protein [Aeromicrobium choanae]|uniref:Ig-like domain (Group 3) n=1 Tax=Aeromicrobium choanae TaxID=1736691 RepID=A0A1T4YRJ2_9ACTN|nr:Ig-like domain-containing protein [Aeromicrobium choanae]SKB03885.1 Ig-like domain (group 3) [Aeromicrobium choanae]
MTTPLRLPLRRGLAAAAVGALTASLLAITPATAQAAPTPTVGVTVDYFDDVYDDLGASSVFETVTIERFEYLLKNQTGNVAFFIGDPSDPSSQATIAHVNRVAKARGISKIYNFTPKLDGDSLNVWDLADSGLSEAGRTFYGNVGNRLITDYLNKDVETTFTKNAATDPYLFVYNKDRQVGGVEDRIVAALAGAKTAADLDTPAEVDAYEDQVEATLGSVGSYATNTNFTFQKDEVNRRHSASYPNAETHGGEILTDADSTDGFRIQTVTYPELLHLLDQPGDIPLLFGGTWCHNTRAIIKQVNADAQTYGVRTVYNFDFSLFSTGNGGSDLGHIRDNALPTTEDGVTKVSRPSHLYGDLVNDRLTNAITQYRTTQDVADLGGGSVNAVSYFPGGDTSKTAKQARKIQVGHVLTYNKDHVDALGERAPVVDQAIRRNDDGGNTEHMTEWWYVAGRDLPLGDAALRGSLNPASEAGANSLQSQRAFAKEAVAEIDTVFRGLAGRSHASTTTVAEVGPVSVGGTPTLDVSVAAAGYAPFISLNSANANTALLTDTGRPSGLVAVFDGAEKVGQARLKRNGTASITLPAQPAGESDLTVRYLGRGDVIDPSQTTVSFAVAGDPSTTTLAAPPSLTFGTGGSVTATVTEGATGSVRLQGLPGDPVTGTIENGVASLAVPTSTPAGRYTLLARYTGDDRFGASESEPVELVVGKANAALKATVAGTRYGTAPVVKATVTGPAGVTPTGTVTVTTGGKSYVGRVSGAGAASVALPRTLTPKAYALTIVYSGDANVRAASTTSRVTVAKGAVGSVKLKPRKTVRAKKVTAATVTVATPSGLAKATGKVRIVLKRGSSTKAVVATVRSGRATVKLPKLTKGTWTAKVSYLGSTTYTGRTVTTKVKVKG